MNRIFAVPLGRAASPGRYALRAMEDCLEVSPGNKERTVVGPGGKTLPVPSDWAMLEPGDAAATRRVKKAGPHWIVKVERRRRMVSLGVWAPAETIHSVRAELQTERDDPAYDRKLAQGRARRAKEQEVYADDFERSVREFLRFSLRYDALESEIAKAVAAHATPVGSGTVARTKRIPIEKRAEAAVIAWMRHQTTAYDSMKIARVKGRRREIRRQLAERSRDMLGAYRRGDQFDLAHCPLARALKGHP